MCLGVALLATGPARAQIDLGGLVKKAAKARRRDRQGRGVKKVNAKLLAEGRKNQCSFKTDSDQLAPGCDAKLKKLTNALVDAKKQLDAGGGQDLQVRGLRPHRLAAARPTTTRSCRSKRAAVIVKELVARGIPQGEIIAVGLGSEQPLVTPDDTARQEGQEPPLRDPGPGQGAGPHTPPSPADGRGRTVGADDYLRGRGRAPA